MQLSRRPSEPRFIFDHNYMNLNEYMRQLTHFNRPPPSPPRGTHPRRNTAATSIQRHVRGTRVRKPLYKRRPNPILVQNPNGTFSIVMPTHPTSVLFKIIARKKAKNKEMQRYLSRIARGN